MNGEIWALVGRFSMTVYAPGSSYATGEYFNGDMWRAECWPPGLPDVVTAEAATAEGAIMACAEQVLARGSGSD